MKEKKKRKITLVTFSQSIFLTIKYFIQNRLLSYAGACSFSFLFSFIPVSMMIVIVLVRFLHASPETVEWIFEKIPELNNYISLDTVIKSIQSITSVHFFEIVIGFFILWMARRFFASIFDSLHNIFHTQKKRSAMWNQALTVIIEVLIVIIVAIVIFFVISLRTVAELSPFNNFLSKFPQLAVFLNFVFNGIILSTITRYLPSILLCIILFIIYKAVPTATVKKKICFLAAFLCSFSFLIFQEILHIFLNTTSYNLIYGVLGQVIITLMDIYFFFTFFLFFAQFIFVYHFFDELLLGELYLLPKKNEVGLLGMAKVLLFIQPDYLLAEDSKVLNLKANCEIFKKGDASNDIFYIVNGTIQEIRNETKTIYQQGDFFGEVGCIIRKNRNSTTTTLEKSKIIKISPKSFELLIKQNSDVAKKVLGHISSHFEEIAFVD